MSKFVQVEFSPRHEGVERMEIAVSYLRSRSWGYAVPRMEAGILVSAGIAALVVTAGQLIESIGDGHLLALWLALWVVGFVAMVFLSRPMAQLIRGFLAAWRTRQQVRAALARDMCYWQSALDDDRIMADIRGAMARVGG